MTDVLVLLARAITLVAALFWWHGVRGLNRSYLYTKPDPYWRHHFWIGVLLVALPGVPWWARIIGAYIACDDAYQHWRQVREPDYDSPLHRLYEWVWVLVYRWIGIELP